MEDKFPQGFLDKAAWLLGEQTSPMSRWEHRWHPDGRPVVIASWKGGDTAVGTFSILDNGDWAWNRWEDDLTWYSPWAEDEFSPEEIEQAQLFLEQS